MDLVAAIADIIIKGTVTIAPALLGSGVKSISQRRKRQNSISAAVKQALASAADSVVFSNEGEATKVRTFLLAPDVESMIRQLLAARLTTNIDRYADDIRNEFLAALSL